MGHRRETACTGVRAGGARGRDRARPCLAEMILRGGTPLRHLSSGVVAIVLAFAPLRNGRAAGAAPEPLFDYDNDGDLDVFLVQGGAIDGSGPSTSRLFRNDLTIGADGRRSLHFTDVTERAGVGLRAYGMGVAVGDYDNDGYLDLFVTSFGGVTLYHNNGDGTFTNV